MIHKRSVLQCVAVCCSVLQCVAVRCSVLQCVAVCCSVGNDWQTSPIFQQENCIFRSNELYSLARVWRRCAVTKEPYIPIKWAQYFNNRALYSHKESPIFCLRTDLYPKALRGIDKRAVQSNKRAVYSNKRALCSNKRAPYSSKRASYSDNRGLECGQTSLSMHFFPYYALAKNAWKTLLKCTCYKVDTYGWGTHGWGTWFVTHLRVYGDALCCRVLQCVAVGHSLL